MKKLLILFAFALGVGSFSFAEASTIYSQPIANTVVNNARVHHILVVCAPVNTQNILESVSFVTGTDDDITTAGSWALYVWPATDATCGSMGTIGINANIGSLATSTGYTFDVSSYAMALATTSYVRVEVYNAGATIGNQSMGTTGLLNNGDIDQNSSLTLKDGLNNDINWAAIQVSPPIDFTAIRYVATSSSIFQGLDASSTLEAIANDCADAGNIFSRGICRAFSYLFIPNPTVINQFQTIGPDLATRFPASWFYQVQTEIDSFSTTTVSAPTWSMNLHDIGIGSSTPMGNFLPNITFFSSTTITQYFPSGTWEAGQLLLAATFWMAAFYTLYAIGHRLFMGQKHSV